jgi:serine protease inhibitor
MGLLGCWLRKCQEDSVAKAWKSGLAPSFRQTDHTAAGTGVPGSGRCPEALCQATRVDAAQRLEFATALFRAAAGDGAFNFVCSPWSVASALAALAPGTESDAQKEIAAAVGKPDRVRSEAAWVAESSAGDEAVLEVANRLWVDEARTPNPSFLAELAQWPGAGLRTAPISRDPEEARILVNADVAATTRGLIPAILQEGTLDGMTALLVNALYLLAGWREPFRREDTVDEAFHAPAGTRDVAMMRAHRETGYARAASWQYVSLLLGAGMAAEIVLPPEPPMQPLTAGHVATLRKAATPHRVGLHLPRTSLEAGTRLAEPLAALGVRRIFDVHAPAVTGVADRPLFISDAVHRAVLRVDEDGIEGAAATAMIMATVAFRSLPDVEMVVDRPFYLLIGHRATGIVLFMARVAEP